MKLRVSKPRSNSHLNLDWLSVRESNRRLFAIKSVARGRGVVIMVENDNEPRKEVTKEAKPPGQSQKTKF